MHSKTLVQHQSPGSGRDPREEPAVGRPAGHREGPAGGPRRPEGDPDECHPQRREIQQVLW